MAKITAPILSLRGSGQIGKSIVFASWRGVPYARQLVVPRNPQTTGQTTTRNTFGAMQNLWKRLGAIARAPWTAFATGKPFTNRNAFGGQNLAAMRGQVDRTDYIASPGANGGVAPTAVTGTGGASSGEIDVTVTSPPTPTGWTLVSAQVFAMQDGDPADQVPAPIAEAENTSPTEDGDTVVTVSGLEANTLHVIAGWLEWTKPDGSTAYGAAIANTATSTT